MLKRTLTLAALLCAFGLSAQVKVQHVASKDQAVFGVEPTRIVVDNTTQPAARATFSGAELQHTPGNPTKQAQRPQITFGVEPRRIKPVN